MSFNWKWSNGDIVERSKRPISKNTNTNSPIEQPTDSENLIFRYKQEHDAFASSLNYDENTWDILNQTTAHNGFKSSNRREELDTMISERHLVQQRGVNPFLSQNDYVNDIQVSNQFLQPSNTNNGL
jgi:hypothetical protein